MPILVIADARPWQLDAGDDDAPPERAGDGRPGLFGLDQFRMPTMNPESAHPSQPAAQAIIAPQHGSALWHEIWPV